MKIPPILLALPLGAALSACATTSTTGSAAPAEAPMASTSLMAGDGSARGTATVTEAADGLHVLVQCVKSKSPGEVA